MKLFELLNINKEHCFFLQPYPEEQKRIKELELNKHGTLQHFDYAMKYEAALNRLLDSDRKETIISFNKLENLLVDIEIINFNFNSTALCLAPYYDNNKLLLYCIEMYKLFYFYKEAVHNWIKILIDNPQIAIEGKKKLLYSDDFLNNLCLFPHFAMMCETDIEFYQQQQSVNAVVSATAAQLKLWDNANDNSF